MFEKVCLKVIDLGATATSCELLKHENKRICNILQRKMGISVYDKLRVANKNYVYYKIYLPNKHAVDSPQRIFLHCILSYRNL